MSDDNPGADQRDPVSDEPPTLPLPPRKVAEGDELSVGTDQEPVLRTATGEVDGVDEPEVGEPEPDESAYLLPTAAAEEPDGEGRGMPEDLEEYLEEADEEAEEEADEGRYDAPPLPPVLILGVVGLLAGFVTIALIWLSEQGCDRVRDSPNCGAAGFPLLVLAVVITIVLGSLALSRLAMPHPKLVAFLGVGFMLLLVLAFGSNDLFSTWTLVVVPVLTAITFLVANLIAGRLERADA
jgi:hypothetical protein